MLIPPNSTAIGATRIRPIAQRPSILIPCFRYFEQTGFSCADCERLQNGPIQYQPYQESFTKQSASGATFRIETNFDIGPTGTSTATTGRSIPGSVWSQPQRPGYDGPDQLEYSWSMTSTVTATYRSDACSTATTS